MTIMKSDFLAVVHEHDFSRGVFGTAEAPCHINQVPYRYNDGEVMSMGDMYSVSDWQDKAMAADKSGTWPESFVAEIQAVKAQAEKASEERRS